MGKRKVVCLHRGKAFGRKAQRSSDARHSVDEPQKHDGSREKPGTKGHSIVFYLYELSRIGTQ